MMKKILAFLLAALMLSASLASCGGQTSGQQTTPADGTTAPSENPADTTTASPYLKDDLPELNFDGATVGILYYSGNAKEMVLTTENDIVCEAVNRRNQKVEERLGIKLNLYTDEEVGWNDFGPYVRKLILANDTDFQIADGHQDTITRQITLGALQNLADADYLDLEKPWWSTGYINSMVAMQDKIYLVSGDANLLAADNTSAMFFNKNLVADVLSDIGEEGLYQMALEGKWTVEQLDILSRKATADLDGDQILTVDDRYGLADCNVGAKAFVIGAGVVMTSRDEDGELYIDLDHTGNLEALQALGKLYEKDGGMFRGTNPDSRPWLGGDRTEVVDMFISGRAVFATGDFGFVEDLRNMEDPYGFLPYPKASEQQESYRSRPGSSASMFAISSLTVGDDFSRACAVLECLASESYRLVMPIYYEKAMKAKYVWDSTSGKVIDLIHSCSYCEFASVFEDYVGNPLESFCGLAGRGGDGFAHTVAELTPSCEKELAKYLKKYEKLK